MPVSGRVLAIAGAAATLALASAGCRHRGAGWDAQPNAISPGAAALEIVVIGQARVGAASRHVADDLSPRLSTGGPGSGEGPVVVWLGTDFGRPGPERSGECTARSGDGLDDLRAVIDEHRARGGTVVELPGPDGWRCGLATDDALASVVRVNADGTASIVSRCDASGCRVEPPTSTAALDIVALDFSPWHYPELASPARTEAILARQAALVHALSEQPGPPRVLASPIPVDSAGPRGYGGRLQRTGFRYLPEFVRRAIADGLFVGVVGALDRGLQVSEDLNPAIVRSSRSFIATPVFQVVSGSAGGGRYTPITSRAHGVLPELESEHTGYARLLIEPDANVVDLRLHARVAGRWREGSVRVPLRAEPHDAVRPATRIQPCQDCDPVVDAADGPAWVPRGERPR